MIDENQIKLEIKALSYRIASTSDAIDDHRRKVVMLKQQKKELRKELLEAQQLLWEGGGKE